MWQGRWNWWVLRACAPSIFAIMYRTFLNLTSVPKKRIPSAVVYYYCAWYSFFRNGRYHSPCEGLLQRKVCMYYVQYCIGYIRLLFRAFQCCLWRQTIAVQQCVMYLASTRLLSNLKNYAGSIYCFLKVIDDPLKSLQY